MRALLLVASLALLLSRGSSYECGSLNVMLVLSGDSSISSTDWDSQVLYAKQAVTDLGVGGDAPSVRMGIATDSSSQSTLNMCLTEDPDVLLFQLNNRMSTRPGGSSDLSATFDLVRAEFSASSISNNVAILITKASSNTNGVSLAAADDLAIISVSTNTSDTTLASLCSTAAEWGTHSGSMSPFTARANFSELNVTRLENLACEATGSTANQTCVETLEILRDRADNCACGCSDQTTVLLVYIFIDLLISSLRAFWMSYAAIKAYLIGQKTALSPKGIREHACSLVYIWLLGLSLAFFRSPCPDNWAELPMMVSSFVIYLLMWMPAFVRTLTAENKTAQASEELTKDFKILWQYWFGVPEDSLEKGIKGGRGSLTLGIGATVKTSELHNTPSVTPTVTPRSREVEVKDQDVCDDILHGQMDESALAQMQVNPLADAEADADVQSP